MANFWVRRIRIIGTKFECLVPADAASARIFAKLPFDRLIEIDSRVPRSAQFHRLVFALFNILANAFDEDVDVVRHKLMVSIGEYTEVHFPDGSIDRRPNSIAYDKMDDTRFKEFFERLVKAVYIIYDMLPADTRREVNALLAPDAKGLPAPAKRKRLPAPENAQ